jgi:hypothetical protein
VATGDVLGLLGASMSVWRDVAVMRRFSMVPAENYEMPLRYLR